MDQLVAGNEGKPLHAILLCMNAINDSLCE